MSGNSHLKLYHLPKTEGRTPLDMVGFGIANNWIKSSSMLLNLRFNQGANRFIRANGRFMPFIEGKIYWAIDYVGIPLFLGQF